MQDRPFDAGHPPTHHEALGTEKKPAALPASRGHGSIEKVLGQLNTICENASFDFALSVGHLIIDNFYLGDVDGWRSQGINNASFRRLARHPDLPMSPARLYRSVNAYERSVRPPRASVSSPNDPVR